MSVNLFPPFWSQKRKINSNKADYVSVIGAGLPRTGTLSLKTALEILGFGPCHHMTDLFEKPDRSVQFARAYDGHKVNFLTLMKGYGSTVDAPTADFYKEIHQAYPKAKIVLTVRDSGEKWFESYKNTIETVHTDSSYFYAVYPIRHLRLQCSVARRARKRWTDEYGDVGPWVHDQHNAQVISDNKKEDLLVFNVKEGWAPLCKFLGVEIPLDIPFPRVNERNDRHNMVRRRIIMGSCIWLLLVASIAIPIYFLISLIS